MKRILFLAIAIALPLSLYSFSETSADDKDAEIRKFIEITDMVDMTDEVVTLVVNQIVTTLQSSNQEVPEFYFTIIREEVPKVINENVESYIEAVIPIIKNNFTKDEIKGLVEFYQSPLGKKLLEKQPVFTAEIVQEAMAWSKDLEPILIERVSKRIEEEEKKRK